MKVKDKVVVVTGGATGIGAALARLEPSAFPHAVHSFGIAA